MLISERDLDWLAGWLEGEGTFCTKECTSKGYTYKVAAIVGVSTDYDVIERVSKLLTVNVNTRPKQQEHHKQPYSISINGALAINWMIKLYPLMGKRRQQAINHVLSNSSERKHINKSVAEQVRHTYRTTELNYVEIGHMYNISRHMASRIIRGLSWRSEDT